MAGGGIRLVGLLIDLALASLITSLFLRPNIQDTALMQTYNLWSGAVWLIITVLPVAFVGFTPGMAVMGIRVARLDGATMVNLWRALVRGALTCLILPALMRNLDGRSWLDRATATVVVRFR